MFACDAGIDIRAQISVFWLRSIALKQIRVRAQSHNTL